MGSVAAPRQRTEIVHGTLSAVESQTAASSPPHPRFQPVEDHDFMPHEFIRRYLLRAAQGLPPHIVTTACLPMATAPPISRALASCSLPNRASLSPRRTWPLRLTSRTFCPATCPIWITPTSPYGHAPEEGGAILIARRADHPIASANVPIGAVYLLGDGGVAGLCTEPLRLL